MPVAGGASKTRARAQARPKPKDTRPARGPVRDSGVANNAPRTPAPAPAVSPRVDTRPARGVTRDSGVANNAPRAAPAAPGEDHSRTLALAAALAHHATHAAAGPTATQVFAHSPDAALSNAAQVQSAAVKSLLAQVDDTPSAAERLRMLNGSVAKAQGAAQTTLGVRQGLAAVASVKPDKPAPDKFKVGDKTITIKQASPPQLQKIADQLKGQFKPGHMTDDERVSLAANIKQVTTALRKAPVKGVATPDVKLDSKGRPPDPRGLFPGRANSLIEETATNADDRSNKAARLTPATPTHSTGSMADAPSASKPIAGNLGSGNNPAARAKARKYAKEYGIDPDVYEAQINQESGFRNIQTDNSSGAGGIAQFIASTAAAEGVKDRFNEDDALRGGARMMAKLVKQYGSYARALSAYNSGRPDAYKDPGFANGQTYNYVRIILKKDAGAGSAGGTGSLDAPAADSVASGGVPEPGAASTPSSTPSSGGGSAPAKTTATSSTAASDDGARRAALAQFLLNPHEPSALASALASLADLPKATTATANFDGKAVPAQIAKVLTYARAHGWDGKLQTAGAGSVDVTAARKLAEILRSSGYSKSLTSAGPKDPGHFTRG